ncbi:hypothetical protein OSB04_018885 [Centaurea solstitialis]|uniref:Reverse transcriptase Ty1/copia-type domain-containing protein n=1 Tax=Centaurea solstitialis TaxID=347529 RepID=A0AA38T7P5_9ASTR|nr:hypothetical protein OSB04_018885 [Centaurea solstitialis]
MYRQSLTNQGVSISLLRRKVMDFENFYSLDSDDDTTYPVLNHSMANPKPKPDMDPNVAYDVKVFLDEGDDPSGLIPKKKKSVVLKPEKPAESQASGSEKSNPKGAKRVGTDREKSVKPHTPKVLQNKNSNSNDACASVKPIKSLDFDSSTFEVGETSRVKPTQPFNYTKPNFSKPSSGKGGKSISVKPSSNSHHALNADARRKDGGKNVKPPRKDHQERNNTFLASPKKHSPGRAGLGYAPPSVGFHSHMSVNRNRNLNDTFDAFRNDMCFMFDNFLRYGVTNSFNAPKSNVKSRKRRGRKRGKATSSSSVMCGTLKSQFQMSLMGELTFFLGLQVRQRPDGIFINQSKYVHDLLKRFDFGGSHSAATPMPKNFQLNADSSGKPVDQKTYRAIIGSLLYLTASRPDIVFSTGVCARFHCDPRDSHLSAVKRILRYLKGTPDFGLWYPKDSGFELIAYTDSDHAGCKLNRKSTSGACQFLGDKLVSWSSRKQNCVSLSTAEAEYVAAACCCSQVLWMKTQLADFGYTMQRIPIYCDSKSAIQITANPVQHSRTKHIDIKYHFIKDHVKKDNVELYFVESDYQLADLFTKPFDEKHHFFLLSKLGMLDLPA